VEDLPSVEDVKQRVNKRYDEMFFRDANGKLQPYVCTVCDEVLMAKEDIEYMTMNAIAKAKHLLSWDSLSNEDRIADVEEHYKFNETLPEHLDSSILDGMALSPRGHFHRKPRSKHGGFVVCGCCKSALTSRRKKYVPLYAVVNKNYVGCAPKCLTDLNEVELAFLSPHHTHGYCFTHTGGTQKQLKGTLSFMRVKERRIVGATATLENMTLTEHVVVLCHGRMTEAQRKTAYKRTSVNTDKLIDAAKWLCENHHWWKDVDYETIKEELKEKRVFRVDRSVIAESTNATVEMEEIYTCYYPDGSNTEMAGGFDDPGAFADFVAELQKRNFCIEMKVNLEKQFVKDNDADQLIGSCLLQFPYGRCGLEEHRVTKDSSSSTTTNLTDFLRHLSRLSNVVFQTPMIQLISHTMLSRARLLKMAWLKVRGEKSAKDIADGLVYSDLKETIEQERLGNRHGGTRISRNFLQSVKACTSALPHTNEAAKSARSTSESMQHYLGSGSVFLTVTFDDENSLLMQVLSGQEIDTDDDLTTLEDVEFRKRRRERRQIQLQYPGVAALH